MACNALRVWPKIQISADKNEPTIPTAARTSVALSGTLPTTAASVAESIGSAIPANNAGTARRFIFLKESGLVVVMSFSVWRK